MGVNEEVRRSKFEVRSSKFFIRTSNFFILLLILTSPLLASNNLSVERRMMRFGETLGITISLEDEFADLEHVRVPLRNLVIDDPPSIASEFSWINGTVVSRKVLRYRARAIAPGPALVGPLVLRAGGQTDTLAFEHAIIATGSHPARVPGLSIDSPHWRCPVDGRAFKLVGPNELTPDTIDLDEPTLWRYAALLPEVLG